MAHHQGAATDIVVPNCLVAHSGDGITFTPIDLGGRVAQPSCTWVPAFGRRHRGVGAEDAFFMGGLIEEGTDPYFERIFLIAGSTPWVPCWNSTATACSCPVTASPWTHLRGRERNTTISAIKPPVLRPGPRGQARPPPQCHQRPMRRARPASCWIVWPASENAPTRASTRSTGHERLYGPDYVGWVRLRPLYLMGGT